MKKLLYTIAIAIGLTSCYDVNDEIYDDLKPATIEKEVVEYTLEAADYETIGKLAEDFVEKNYLANKTKEDTAKAKDITVYLKAAKSFNKDVDANAVIPFFLEDKYYSLNVGSSITVNYLYYYAPDEIDGFTIDTLQSADYKLMGTSAGTPGQYNNFSNSTRVENYLPKFYTQKYPFAKLGDKRAAHIKYYKGYSTYYVIPLEYKENGWEIIYKSSTFGVDKSRKVVVDPTVVFTMNKSDFEFIVQAARDDASIKKEWFRNSDKSENSEYFYGASSHYGNFEIRNSKRTDFGVEYDGKAAADYTDAELTEKVMKYLKKGLTIMLAKKFPDATIKKDGLDVFYEVTFKYYNGSSDQGYMTAKARVKTESPLEFEITEDPTRN